MDLRLLIVALVDAAQLVGRHPANWKVKGSIPGQGTGLGRGSCLGWAAYERQPFDISLPHRCFSLSFSLPSPLSKIKKYILG